MTLRARLCLTELKMNIENRILYEDNHIIVINKLPGEIVQGDKTGDITLAEDVQSYLKEKYNKPGNVFIGIPHRLDRPTSGIVIYAKTSKALERLNEMFRTGAIEKHYWAVCDKPLTDTEGRLEHYLVRDSSKNKSFAYSVQKKDSQKAVLEYKQIGLSERYVLLEINLITGRHHQIRAQLAACGVHIKGDLKYGFPRSNPDGGICLHSRYASFIHPVTKQKVEITAPVPEDRIWHIFP